MSSLCYRKITVQSAAVLTLGLRRVKTESVESNSNSTADSVPSEKEKKKTKNNSVCCGSHLGQQWPKMFTVQKVGKKQN